MADFADIATNASINVKVFVKVSPVDVTTGTATDLYFAYGNTPTNKVDGILRNWEGRLRGATRIGKLDQKIGSGTFVHPMATFSLWIGDEDDALWDEFGDDDDWVGAACKVWTVDMEQDWTSSIDNGRRLQIDGTISRGPNRMGINRALQFEVRGAFLDVALPNQVLASATESACAYIQPVILNGNAAGALHTTINATETTLIPADAAAGVGNITGYAVGQVVFICDAGASTNPEQMYVTAVNAGPTTIEVIRGYNGTTSAAHTAGDPLYAMQPGPNPRINTVNRNGLVVPYVFAAGLVDRNPYFNVTAYQAGRQTRQYAANPFVEAMLSMGKGPTIPVGKTWYLLSGGNLTVGNDDAYNDEDSVFGTALAWGTQVPADVITNYHLQPHIELTGTYQDLNRNATAIEPTDLYWTLVRGITVDGTTGGAVIRYPCGIMLYLLTDSSFALGYAAADVIHGTRITDFDAGDWADEFDTGGAEEWWSQIAATIPTQGTTEQVKLMDLLQELANLGQSDIWTRDGLLYPAKRAVAGTADWTIEKWDYSEAPERVKDPQNIYCNRITAGFGQPLLCEPLAGVPGSVPVEVPYTVTVEDQDEIAAHGMIDKTTSTAWCYCNFADQWIQNIADDDDPQTAHLEWWEDAAQAQLDQRAQPQQWMEVKLPERFAAIEQGDTIEFDVAPHTTRKGQVRQVDLITDETGRVDQVKVRSWHIDF